MGIEWRQLTLADIAEDSQHSFVDGPFGSNLPASCYMPSGVPIIRGSNLSLGPERFKSDTFVYVSDETADRLKRSCCKPNDLIFTKKGTLGQAGIVPDNGAYQRYLLSGNQMKLTVDQMTADPLFVFYVVSSRESRTKIIQDSEVTGVPKTNLTYLKTFPILLPPLPEQKAIAHILGSLDDKIELNRRMNATLEAMAQALFKSWFVDFDPVIDNALAAGNPIPDEFAVRAEVRRQALADGSAKRNAAKAFPAAFQESEELGWIPEGWEVSTIGEECETVGGGTPSTKNPDFWEGGEYPWVTPKDFSELQDKVLLSSSRFLTEEGLGKVSSGLLPIGTVLMSSRAPVGYLAITQIETAINQGFIAMICNKQLPPEYILQWANSRMDDIKRAAGGSTFAEISKKAFRPFEITVPSQGALAAYTETAGAIYEKIADGVLASHTLTKLRDTLLPKLISGELRIEDVEKMMGRSNN